MHILEHPIWGSIGLLPGRNICNMVFVVKSTFRSCYFLRNTIYMMLCTLHNTSTVLVYCMVSSVWGPWRGCPKGGLLACHHVLILVFPCLACIHRDAIVRSAQKGGNAHFPFETGKRRIPELVRGKLRPNSFACQKCQNGRFGHNHPKGVNSCPLVFRPLEGVHTIW